MKKFILALFAAIVLSLAGSSSAFAIHSTQWAADQACAATAGYGQSAVQPYGGCNWSRGGWVPQINKFEIYTFHFYAGGCGTHNPWALQMITYVTDGGSVSTNFADWSWKYC